AESTVLGQNRRRFGVLKQTPGRRGSGGVWGASLWLALLLFGRGIRRLLLRWRGGGIFVGLWGICPLCFGNTARRGCAVSFFGLYRLRAVYLTIDRRMSGDVWEKTRANPVQGSLGGLCAAQPFVSWFLIIWKLAWKEST
ncbi:MAG: hypothetical protein K2P33_12210, partial [Acutalibacter sp.]|nr:hypothetical protein [Acutalibacter sp.]